VKIEKLFIDDATFDAFRDSLPHGSLQRLATHVLRDRISESCATFHSIHELIHHTSVFSDWVVQEASLGSRGGVPAPAGSAIGEDAKFSISETAVSVAGRAA